MCHLLSNGQYYLSLSLSLCIQQESMPYAYPVSILHNLILPLSSIWNMPFCQCPRRPRLLLFLLRRSIILSCLFTARSLPLCFLLFSFASFDVLLPIILTVQVWLFLVKSDFIWNCMLSHRNRIDTWLYLNCSYTCCKVCVVFTDSVIRNLSQAFQLYIYRFAECKRKTKIFQLHSLFKPRAHEWQNEQMKFFLSANFGCSDKTYVRIDLCFRSIVYTFVCACVKPTWNWQKLKKMHEDARVVPKATFVIFHEIPLHIIIKRRRSNMNTYARLMYEQTARKWFGERKKETTENSCQPEKWCASIY